MKIKNMMINGVISVVGFGLGICVSDKTKNAARESVENTIGDMVNLVLNRNEDKSQK